MAGASVAALDLGVRAADWADLGFSVDEDGSCRIGATVLRLGRDGEGVTGWALRDASGSGAVDGIATERVAWAPPAPAQHANGTLSVDHVVVTTPDVDRTFAALGASGMTLRRERTAGSVERPLRQGFFRHGECIVEVVGPQYAGDGPAALWGLTLTVADLDAMKLLLADRLGAVKKAVQPQRRIATLRPVLGAALPPIAFMSS